MTRSIASIITGALLFAGLYVSGCGDDPQERAIREAIAKPVFENDEIAEAYVDSINGVRHFKNEWMIESSASPLPMKDRENFTGLDYYPVNIDFVFRTRLHIYDDPEIVMIGTTTGDYREAIRYGYIDFTVDGEHAQLHTYKFTAHSGTELEEYIFIPFKDATSGTETYAGGRYLDITEEHPGVVLIDFNDAYNPYCVYDERYSCPIPPRENHLTVAIRAGEKNYIN